MKRWPTASYRLTFAFSWSACEIKGGKSKRKLLNCQFWQFNSLYSEGKGYLYQWWCTFNFYSLELLLKKSIACQTLITVYTSIALKSMFTLGNNIPDVQQTSAKSQFQTQTGKLLFNFYLWLLRRFLDRWIIKTLD